MAGALWYVAARAIAGLREHSLSLAAGSSTKGLLELIELLVQLLINTLSFARLGAFALAHTGLSTAVMTLADLAVHAMFSCFLDTVELEAMMQEYPGVVTWMARVEALTGPQAT